MTNGRSGLTLTAGPVAVTGAGGFIGSHLVEALVRRGIRVRALIHYNALGSIGNLGNLDAETLSRVEIVAGDIQDPYATRNLVRGCHVVFHLAALIGIPYSYEAPASYVAVNVGGTLNVLEAARAAGAARVIVTSTSETYGTAQYTPIDETHPLVAQSPYAATKIGADQLALSYWRSFGTAVAVVRPFNTFGPRQSERAVIPTIVAQALQGDGTIRLGSISPKRDLTYVTDTVAGFLVLAEHDGAIGRVTNLGTGESRTVGEMVEIVGRSLGRPLRVVEEKVRVRPERSEVLDLCADAQVARSFGWAPAVSFAGGVARVIKYMKDHRSGGSLAGYRI